MNTPITGKTCIDCNIPKPITEFYFIKKTRFYLSSCKACHSKRVAEYRKENEEHYKEYREQYLSENTERMRKYHRVYSRTYYWSHHEQVLENARKWKEANPDKVKQYRSSKDPELRKQQQRDHYYKNRERIIKQNLQYYYRNRDKILAKA